MFPPTNIDDEEFQPAPGVGEVLPESKADPLENHLYEEEEEEHHGRDAHHHHHDFPLMPVNVLEHLQVDTLR